ncbi:MAG: glycoside hydrolase family 43 protein [Nakamurella sp.]
MNGPVYDTDFPDPDVVALEGGKDYLAFATNGNGRNVQVVGSADLQTWEQLDDALPVLPGWTTEGKVWAPEVIELADGRWAMYYTTMAPDPAIQCIGVAFADEPAGPYRDTRSGPLVCETKTGGSIDAHPFRAADGALYLFWKNDGNAVGVDTWISGQRLAADGVTLQGSPKQLFRQDLPWEGELVEAPFLWEHDGKFFMFYSANSYASADYAVGYAVADQPLGTYTKNPEPILVSDDAAAGPGHCSLFTDEQGQVWMAYHAWPGDAPGDDAFGRAMWLSKVSFDGAGLPVVVPPAG